MSDTSAMSDEAKPSSCVAGEEGERLDQLIGLLENDTLGYRLERFVAGEREGLSQKLTAPETFGLSSGPSLTYTDLFDRIQAYDAAVRPYVEFFAVGTTYTRAADASPWTDFLERIGTCHYQKGGGGNDVLNSLALYPALLLLYGAGVLAVARARWAVFHALVSHRFAREWREEEPFIRRVNSFAVLSEQGQQAIPGRERQYTPLLNHIHETLKPVLAQYFLSDAKYDAAFTYLEIILAVAFAHEDRETRKRKDGSVPESVRVPPGRYWWLDHGQGTSIDRVTASAMAAGTAWPPTASGMFAGQLGTFVEVAEQIKALVIKRGLW